ncbi:uncharacterized protein EAE97_011236 [Botrytis byssoidea]|uniref:Uncharacterized protein n=1 Tax=Botrytis byssoidea TaxID=139641 RepID=A0A9P5I385_9HELO|nr:uncharacterized protein EAE97_011236 [Botrytis byssoidea]KAF7921945.1 hypothetical protein EAE97_011236 [Botrytis byssoidea]
MDEASKLVRELSNKLTELDHKVDLYRKDMNKEYIKYEEDLLKNVSPNISQTVSRMIAEELKNYKALYPFAENLDTDNLDSCAKITNTGTGTGTDTGTGTGNNNPSSSPGSSHNPISNGNNTIAITSTPHENSNVMTNGISTAMESQLGFGTSASIAPNNTKKVVAAAAAAAEEEERPRSPHAREKEFTGVFTPSYLPLLDSCSRYERKSNSNTELNNKSKDIQMDTSSQSQSQSQSQSLVDASTDTRSLNASPDPRSPSIPKRKNTDEISIASNSSSDGPRRRSALRRTSTSSKNTSPRRVRFDVEGEEVLPTASPKELEPMLPPSFSDDSDDEAGSEMVEDIDAPPPKRISSSQALRALSRGPLEDDGTQWTTVVAPPDGSASVDTLEDDGYTTNYFDSRPTPIAPRDENIPPVSIPTKISQPEPQAQVKHIEALPEDDADVPSDDDMLDMPSLRQMRSYNKQPASILSPKKNENPEPAISPLQMNSPSKPLTLETMEPRGKGDEKTASLTFQDDEQEDLFSFDENPSLGSRPQDEEDESDIEEPTSPSIEESPDNVELSKSPARPIPNDFSNKKVTIAPAPAHGIVGSYKGRPFSMPVVNDAVHASAASMGAMNSFVGSVNGRSGLDASDVLSYRASGGVGSFSGTPKSMSERMMMDDLMEAEGENQKN